MIMLKLGLMTGMELAEWFGVCESTYKHSKQKKLEELKIFAEFYELNGRIYITKILHPVYVKGGKRRLNNVLQFVDKEWGDLNTCSNVAKKLHEANSDLTSNQAYYLTYSARNFMWHKPFTTYGPLGYCEYVWCKKIGDKYELFSEEEEEIKKRLITKYFGDTTEKQLLVQDMIDEGEITEAEAWCVFQKLTDVTHESFMDYLDELQSAIRCKIARGTLVFRGSEFGENYFILENIETFD